MRYKGLVLADIHIGAFNVEKLYNELSMTLFESLRKNYNFIIICGDYFDRKLFLNDKESLYAYNIMTKILELVGPETKVRIVYGTESHECNQYKILSELDNHYDIKVIDHVCSEELFPDMKVLYVPEEHILDKTEYYSEYFKNEKEYNYIFGHGIIREVMKEAATLVETKAGNRKKVPTFSTAELNRVCRGQTYFGHYHVNTSIGDSVFYVGSFSRWHFGEEQPKGYYEIEYDVDRDEYFETFIENTICDTFHTISFGYDNDIFKSTTNMEKKLDKVDKLIKDDLFDHVRFEFNIPESAENPEYMINYINERYKYRKDVKVEIVHGYIEQRRERDKEQIKKENEKYDILFDKNVSIEDKVSYFIGVEYNRKISTEKVYKYLYNDIDNILKD